MHRCPPKTLQVLIVELEEEAEEELGNSTEPILEVEEYDDPPKLQHLHLSVLTSFRFDGPQTMKSFGQVGNSQLLIMINSGASHCFVTEQVAKLLNRVIEPTNCFSVILGDGTRVQTGGIYNNVPLILDSKIFYIFCYVIPILSVDIILGVSLLATLGDVKANWSKLTMEFVVNGHCGCLRGHLTLTRRVCFGREIRSLLKEDEYWLLWTLEQV